MSLNTLTIEKAHDGLKKKDFSSRELTKSCFEHIQKTDKDIHAFITLLEKEALKAADVVDEKGDFFSPMAGIPLAIKDNMAIAGTRTTAGSRILENYIAPYDATVISRLKKEGAVFLGKTNMDEFACGSSTETSYFGVTKNPHDLERVPGGSSGGSAAALATHQCIAALGSDTGGSVRQPAAFCGVVGLKPTYGRVSRSGLFAMASSLDQIGTLTKTVQDAAYLLYAIAGEDAYDATTAPIAKDDYVSGLEKGVSGLIIGVPKEYFSKEVRGVDENVKKAIWKSLEKLKSLGADIDDTISLPHAKYGLSVYYILMPSELSANLERYDGVKYGFSDRSKSTLLDNYLDTRGKGFGAEIRRRIMLGTYALSAGYYDAYYKQSLKVRTLVTRDFLEAFKKVHCIITPTSPTVAFRIGEKTSDPLSMYLSDVYTVSANIAGIPALSIPCGSTKPKDGYTELPIGLQIMGRHFDEKTILQVAATLERTMR